MIYEGTYKLQVEAESANEARAILADCAYLIADAIVDGEPQGLVSSYLDAATRKVER